MEEILTAEQVAQILQVHPFTVLKFIKQGKLKASKLGRVYRIRKSDVDKFLDNQIEQTQASKPAPLQKQVQKSASSPKAKKQALGKVKTSKALGEGSKESEQSLEHKEHKGEQNPNQEKTVKITVSHDEPGTENDTEDHYVLELKGF